MNRIAILPLLALMLITAACGGDTKLPDATGKASIRVINAIKTAPDVAFLIEERLLADVSYRASSAISEYDDLDYTFNFEVSYAGEDAPRRIASQYIDFVADQEYTLILSGTVANPELGFWEIGQREFAAGETVFQIRFSHNSEFLRLTALDYYLAPVGVVPAAGEAISTVAFGELSPPLDIEADTYVLTITSENNPADIVYTSGELVLAAGTNLIISPFDASPSRTTDFTVHIFGAQAGSSEIADVAAPTTVEFLHASIDLGAVHIYDDEALTSQILADHMYTDLSPEITIAAGDNTFRYTSTTVGSGILVEGNLGAIAGLRYRFTATGVNTAFFTSAVVLDTRPLETSAKFLIAQTSNNFDVMQFYIVDSGEMIDDTNRLQRTLSSSFPKFAATFPAGDYDIYLTDIGSIEILAGPVGLSMVNGDVVDIVIFDDPSDPAVLDLQILSGP